MRALICLALLLAACTRSTGGIDEPCNHDGTCDGPALVCRFVPWDLAHLCVPREEK